MIIIDLRRWFYSEPIPALTLLFKVEEILATFSLFDFEAFMPVDSLILGSPVRMDHEVVEMPLLLPRWQADALEDAARRKGMTTGQMLRRVIAEMFASGSSEPKR